jgi:hypothetical protein
MGGGQSCRAGAAPALAAVDQVKKKSAGAAVKSSSQIRPAASRARNREKNG